MEPMPEDWTRAVAVVAHPDDLEYGAAAAVARWTGQGKHVAYLLATRGEAGIQGMAPDQVGPLRVEEEQRSAAVVGVHDVHFLDHADGLVEYGLPLRRDLAAVLRAVRDAANPWVFTDAGPAWGGTSEIYVSAVADPTHFVDVTATIGAGVDSLREHKAYIDGLGRGFDPDEFLRNAAGYVGLAAGVEYAVGVRRYTTG